MTVVGTCETSTFATRPLSGLIRTRPTAEFGRREQTSKIGSSLPRSLRLGLSQAYLSDEVEALCLLFTNIKP
jgi:hypothetical protein